MRKKEPVVCNRCRGLLVREAHSTITSIVLHVLRCLNCGNIIEPGYTPEEKKDGKHTESRYRKALAS